MYNINCQLKSSNIVIPLINARLVELSIPDFTKSDTSMTKHVIWLQVELLERCSVYCLKALALFYVGK